MKKNNNAIITLDIINSKNLAKNGLALFMKKSEDLLAYDFIKQVEVYRGDGLQTLLKNAQSGLTTLLLQYCFFKLENIEVRQSLGVGNITQLKPKLAESIGTAFELSGRGLEGMKQENLIASVHFEQEKLNKEWKVHNLILSDFMMNWTTSQLEAIIFYLVGKTQIEIAQILNVSQAAVNQRLKSAKVNLLQSIMNRYQEIC